MEEDIFLEPDRELGFLERDRGLSQDQRAELGLGALVFVVVALLVAMLAFVLHEAWPSFAHNGVGWFGGGGSVDQQIQAIFTSGDLKKTPVYTFHAWPLIWSTILITIGAVAIAFVASLFIAVFMVEFAPPWLRRILEPVVRLLASVPSVIYGLAGVLVLVPFIGNHLITQSEKASVTPTIQLSGSSLLAAVLILTVMIAPIMIAVFADGLRAVPRGWLEGSLALGINQWRTFWKVGVRTARPVFVAGTVLATARALGEAVMVSMVSGGVGFAPNPVDGLIFFFEPSRPLAATIIANTEELNSPPMKHTLYAIAAVLLFSSAMLSVIGWAAKQPMRRYGVVPVSTVPIARVPKRPESDASWRVSDRIGLGLAWLLGLLFCAIAAAIVVYFLVEGIRYLRPNLLVTNPTPGVTEGQTGGFLDPLLGTVIVGVMAMAIAVPVGVGIAVWLSEFGRPTGLARVAESAVEMLAGEPSVVLALFGTILFTVRQLGFLSQTSHGIVLGQSFFATAAMLSLVGLPMVVASTREGLQAIPSHVREASYAVGKTKIATTRRVLLPAARPSMITGTMLGLGRVIGDTAIVLLLLGGTLTFSSANSTPVLGMLRGTGDTLTGYIYYNAPTGDGNQPSKAYAAAFVLMLMVLALNLGVDFVVRRSQRAVRWS